MSEVNLAEVGKFYTIADSSFAEHGIKKGDLVYISSSSYIPVTAKEPDLMRITFTAARTENGHVKADSENKLFLIQNKRLRPISDIKQEKYQAMLVEDFSPKEESDSTAD